MNQLLSNSDIVIAALLILAVVVVALLVALIVQSKRVKDLQEAAKPKYGFLGKPLMAMALLGGLFGAVLLTYNATLRPIDDPIVNADKTLVTTITTNTITQTTGEALVEFKAVPSVDSAEWGVMGDKFDIYWSVTGPITFKHIELDRSRDQISRFTKTLPKGNYEITIEVFFADRRFEKKQNLNL